MKAQIALTALAILVLGLMPVSAAERACRPSLSNMYHCPDTSKPAPKTTTTTTSTPAPRTRTTTTSERPCRPSLSNLWTCPGTSQAQQKSARTTRPREEPSTGSTGPTRRTRTTSPAPGEGQAGEHQYTSERQAGTHCPSDTVVWANTRSNIYHFRGTHNYGATAAGGYMCEQDALAEGMRAAKNETHP
jgi:hypothetical protein